MEKEEIKQLAADIINKKKDLKDIPRGRIFFTLQNIFLNMHLLDLVQAMTTLSGQRLAAKGYRKCEGFGWVKHIDIPNMGIGQVYNKWVVINQGNFMRFKL